MQAWKRFKPDEVIDLKWRKAIIKYFELPTGVRGDFLTIDCLTDDAAVVALTPDGKVVTAKQFRPGPERIMYDLPGGGCDGGESPEVTALRELQEETSYTSSESLIPLGKAVRDVYRIGDTYYYLLLNCHPMVERFPNNDDREMIEVELHDMSEMIEYAKQGLVSDAAALLFAKDKLRELEGN